MKKLVILLVSVILIFGILGLVYADSSCDQACSDAESAAQQAASDASSAKQQAESDKESAKQQAESDKESAKQQAESDFESFLQQSSSDFKSKVEENKDRKVNLEVVNELDENGESKQKIKFRGIGVDTSLNVEGLEEGKAKIRLSDGNYQEVKIMPNTAFKIAVEKLKSSNINIRLEEFEGEDLAAIYVADADKTIKILGIFETKHNLEVEINIEDGEIKVEDKPWWWFLVEEVEEEIEDRELQLIKPIQDIILTKDEEIMRDLDEYFLNAESYSVSDSENIFAEINNNFLKITSENNWTGTTSIKVVAFKGEESLESLFNVIVSEDNLSIQTLQYGAILNEPVKWKKEVKVEGQKRITLKLPKNSENVIIKTDVGMGEILSQRETEDDLEIEVEEDENYEVEYITDAPYALEKDIGQGKQEITIIGSEEVHYMDVLAYKQLPSEVPSDAVKLSLVTGTEKKEIQVEKFDLNNNGLIDYIEWVVPTLSNETYELELNILNIQSYPTVGGNWEVRFTTSGTANLTISAINDTTYGNELPDDLTPLELRCGDAVLSYDWQGNSVFYPDWNCDNKTGYWTVKVLTPGVHAQKFNFGGLIGYAYNFASENITFVPPTPANNSIQNSNSVYVNITSTEALGFALLNWQNSSGYFNVTMSNGSTTNWYKNMASLADGSYSFSVWAQNVSGTWVQTQRRFLSIDASNPTISIAYPANTTYTSNVNSFNYTFTETNPDKCWYSTNGGATNSSAVTCGTNFTGLSSAEGSNTWTVYINDTYGNKNSASVTFTKDTTAPTISIDYPLNTTYNVNVSQLNYTSDGVNCWYSRNSGVTNSSPVSCTIDFTNVISIEGSNTWTVYINDSAGNSNSTSITFFKDTIYPALIISSPLNSTYNTNSVLINFTADSYQSLWYYNGTTNRTYISAETIIVNQGNNLFRFYANDSAGNLNSSSVNFFIDSIYPQISYATGTSADTANLSQSNIYIIVSVTESNEDTITFLLHNSTGQVNSTSYADSTRTINWTSLADAIYTYNITVNDTAGNSNTTATRTITLDTIIPIISFSCSKSSLIAGETLSCSCSATDNLDSSPSVSYTANPSTSNIGAFTTTCSATDYTGNLASSNFSYTVESSSGGGYPNYAISSENLAAGHTKLMRKNWKMNFKIGNKTHTLLVKDIKEDRVDIVLTSEPQEASLRLEDERKFELSGDNYYDLLVRVNSIKKSAFLSEVNLTIQEISEEILEEEEFEQVPEAKLGETKDLSWFDKLINWFKGLFR